MIVFRRFAGVVVVVTLSALAGAQDTRPVDGLHTNTPAVYALTHARLVVAPGQVIENGTLVVRDGVITAMGSDVAVPADAKIRDSAGKTIYPGLIDAYSEVSLTVPEGGAPYWNPMVSPQLRVADLYKPDAALDEKLRGQGVVARLVAPALGIVKGESAVVTTGGEAGERVILRADAALHLRLGVSFGGGRGSGYPNSPMGAVALARQAFLDADWYAKAWAAHQAHGDLPRPERNDALAAMQPYLDGRRPVLIDSANELYFLRADGFAREFSLHAAIRGSGQEYQRLEAIRATGRTVIVPINFPRPPDVSTPEKARNVETADLMHWDTAPENPGRLDAAGVKIALTGNGLREPGEFLGAIRTAVERGLTAEAALRAVTVTSADLLGVADRLGTLHTGKAASFIVTDGDLLDKKTKVVETWIDGRRYEIEKKPAVDPRGDWRLTFASPDDKAASHMLKLTGTPAQLQGLIEVSAPDKKAEEIKLNKPVIRDVQFSATFEGKTINKPGVAQISAVIIIPTEGEPTMSGTIAWPDGKLAPFSGVRVAVPSTTSRPGEEPKSEQPQKAETKKEKEKAKAKEKAPKESAAKDSAAKPEVKPDSAETDKSAPSQPTKKSKSKNPKSKKTSKKNTAKKKESSPDKKETTQPDATNPSKSTQDEPTKKDDPTKKDNPVKKEAKEDRPQVEAKTESKAGESEKKNQESAKPKVDPKASFPVNFPLGAAGRKTPPEQPKQVLIKNATIWTCGPKGTLEKASLLIGGGRILVVGSDVSAAADAVVIDLAGKHISPGIIDCHSHMATDGGVNEGTQAITAEVRVGDFIDCDDMNIYRQLAGGVTCANVLHGSANPIGGQNQVIKLRWGELYEAMKFAEAPPGIKFALGENVKQSNWGNEATNRYPQTRMGVEQIIRDEFQAARAYQQLWKRWETKHDVLPPRRDLELDAVLEILDGKRLVHCHSYRQDEILALLRTCEDFHIRIATLQHILEGYKVADIMARHGAMGSAFSDWWAYKIEVYDAIPYAGALMHHAGVVVSFNSDDQELARHLNHEAAKAVKYGNVPPEQALQFVTLNPARQLRIDQYVGSLEPGKHADFVVWSGPPLSIVSRCEQTWIDGRRFFDLAEDQQQRAEFQKVRATLIQKILSSGQSPRTPEESKKPDEELWPREDLFCPARRS